MFEMCVTFFLPSYIYMCVKVLGASVSQPILGMIMCVCECLCKGGGGAETGEKCVKCRIATVL